MRFLAAIVVLAAMALPAGATEWLICSDTTKKVSFNVLSGSLGIGTATDFELHIGDKSWSTKEGQGTRIAKLQAFEDDAMILVTVSSEGLGEVVAELRVLKAMEADSLAYGGVLKVPGQGAWAVSCPNE